MMEQLFKKIIFCYTGEPRSVSKGLRIRDETIREHISHEADITAKYLISIADGQRPSSIRRLFRATASLAEDKYLSEVQLVRRESCNMYKYIIEQKLDILTAINSKLERDSGAVIILTRPDWAFDLESLQLAAKAAMSKKIIIPENRSAMTIDASVRYKPVCDQFMAIPQEKLNAVAGALQAGLHAAEGQKRPTMSIGKNILLGGDGHNRYGIGPESILGVGFFKTLKEDDYAEVKFNYRFGPGTYDACRHNLIRDDAAAWMQLNPYDIFSKKLLFVNGEINGMRAKLLTLLRKARLAGRMDGPPNER